MKNLMNSLMMMLQAMQSMQTPPADGDAKPTFGTVIIVCLGNGDERQYRFEPLMNYREAQDVLDPILDDMDGGSIVSPVHIHRFYPSGKITTEEVTIYSSEGFEVL